MAAYQAREIGPGELHAILEKLRQARHEIIVKQNCGASSGRRLAGEEACSASNEPEISSSLGKPDILGTLQGLGSELIQTMRMTTLNKLKKGHVFVKAIRRRNKNIYR